METNEKMKHYASLGLIGALGAGGTFFILQKFVSKSTTKESLKLAGTATIVGIIIGLSMAHIDIKKEESKTKQQ